jgi:hypothetical protein
VARFHFSAATSTDGYGLSLAKRSLCWVDDYKHQTRVEPCGVFIPVSKASSQSCQAPHHMQFWTNATNAGAKLDSGADAHSTGTSSSAAANPFNSYNATGASSAPSAHTASSTCGSLPRGVPCLERRRPGTSQQWSAGQFPASSAAAPTAAASSQRVVTTYVEKVQEFFGWRNSKWQPDQSCAYRHRWSAWHWLLLAGDSTGTHPTNGITFAKAACPAWRHWYCSALQPRPIPPAGAWQLPWL